MLCNTIYLITSFSLTSILYSSVYKRISKYIYFPISTIIQKPTQISFTLANVVIDININFIRRRSNTSSNISSRSALVLLKALSILYFKRVKIKNNLPDKDIVELVNSSQLSYKDNNGKDNSVSNITAQRP